MNERNERVIAEFRAHAGRVEEFGDEYDLLLLHTTGAKSGLERINPLVCQQEGDRLIVFASANGRDTHPDWYANLVADPAVTVEHGTETYAATATTLDGTERDEAFVRITTRNQVWKSLQDKTSRVIPIVALDRD